MSGCVKCLRLEPSPPLWWDFSGLWLEKLLVIRNLPVNVFCNPGWSPLLLLARITACPGSGGCQGTANKIRGKKQGLRAGWGTRAELCQGRRWWKNQGQKAGDESRVRDQGRAVPGQGCARALPIKSGTKAGDESRVRGQGRAVPGQELLGTRGGTVGQWSPRSRRHFGGAGWSAVPIPTGNKPSVPAGSGTQRAQGGDFGVMSSLGCATTAGVCPECPGAIPGQGRGCWRCPGCHLCASGSPRGMQG